MAEFYFRPGRHREEEAANMVRESGLDIKTYHVDRFGNAIDPETGKKAGSLTLEELMQVPYVAADGRTYSGKEEIGPYLESQTPQSAQ